MGVSGRRHNPAALRPPPQVKRPNTHCNGWTPGPVWMGAENLADIRIRTRTVQPVASQYIDHAIPAHMKETTKAKP